ncbi:MAG TPA: hypothetical protein PLP23_17455 [Panacibacter sp.]|nr:hypothetical protein [Panacibacter sp.]
MLILVNVVIDIADFFTGLYSYDQQLLRRTLVQSIHESATGNLQNISTSAQYPYLLYALYK